MMTPEMKFAKKALPVSVIPTGYLSRKPTVGIMTNRRILIISQPVPQPVDSDTTGLDWLILLSPT